MRNVSYARRGRRGFTYVEIIVSMGVMALALGSGLMASLRSTEAYRTSDSRATVDTKVRGALQRLVEELSSTGPSVLFPDPGLAGADDIGYRRAVGFDAGAVVWGPQNRLAFEYETGEADDGVDNNGNGLVDEGVLVMTLDVGGPDEQRVVLCHGVSELLEGEVDNGVDDNGNGMDDEAGFCVRREGSVLSVFVTLEEVDQNRTRFQRTLQTSTRMRN